jgi:hypothetical protein
MVMASILVFAWMDQGKLMKITARIAGILAKI